MALRADLRLTSVRKRKYFGRFGSGYALTNLRFARNPESGPGHRTFSAPRPRDRSRSGGRCALPTPSPATSGAPPRPLPLPKTARATKPRGTPEIVHALCAPPPTECHFSFLFVYMRFVVPWRGLSLLHTTLHVGRVSLRHAAEMGGSRRVESATVVGPPPLPHPPTEARPEQLRTSPRKCEPRATTTQRGIRPLAR